LSKKIDSLFLHNLKNANRNICEFFDFQEKMTKTGIIYEGFEAKIHRSQKAAFRQGVLRAPEPGAVPRGVYH
jgi:hypothetical protein